jgi:hypothetical protein
MIQDMANTSALPLLLIQQLDYTTTSYMLTFLSYNTSNRPISLFVQIYCTSIIYKKYQKQIIMKRTSTQYP